VKYLVRVLTWPVAALALIGSVRWMHRSAHWLIEKTLEAWDA
jgi:hypothetical protein